MIDLYSSTSSWSFRTRRRSQHVIQFLNHFISVRGLIIRLADLCLLALAYRLVNGETAGESIRHGATLLLYVVACLSALQTFAMYQRHGASRLTIFWRLAVVYGCAGVAVAGLSRLLPIEPLSQGALLGTVALSFTGSFLLRLALPRLSAFLLPSTRILVVGNDNLAQEVATILRQTDPLEGVEFCGLYDPRTRNFVRDDDTPSRAVSFADIITEESIAEVVVATADQRGLPLADLLRFKMAGLIVTDYVTFLEREKRYLAIDAMRPSWMLFSTGFSHGPARVVAKRLFDIAVSATLLLLFAPVLLLAIVAILVESGRPIFFRQERVGAEGKLIQILKLRSMIPDAEIDGIPKWASKKDDRVTRVGRFLRVTRIDEIPQLLSVLKGDMSFVGPRPERDFFVKQLREQIPYYDLRHTIKPGLSGWAQVSYPYGASIEDARAKLRFDLYYIKNHSLLLDILILLNTIRIVLFGTGAR